MTTQYDRVCRVLVARTLAVSGNPSAQAAAVAESAQVRNSLLALIAAAGPNPSESQREQLRLAELRATLRLREIEAGAASYSSISGDVVEIPGGEAGFRVAFKIEKTAAREPNAAEVTISGLSEATRGALGQRGARPKLIVEAGYVERSGQIFVGDCRPGGIDSTREGPSWITRLRAGDGERAYRWAHVSASFAAGVGAGEVVARCAEALGLGAGNLARHRATLDRERFGSGWCAYEPAARALDRTLANLGWAWSIQDGTIQLEPPTPEGVTAWVLSSDSGLLGSPEMTQPEPNKPARLRAKALLNHAIKPGAHVELDSARYQGVYRVVKATHTGDTHGQEWFTEIEARPVAGAR